MSASPRVSPKVALTTFAIALTAGGVFWWIGLPAAWLTGPLMVVSALAIRGVNVGVPRPVMVVVFLAFGIAMGSGVTADTLGSVMRWPLSIAALTATLFGVMLVTTLYLRVLHGWDRPTAFYASVPGALSQTLVVAATSAADLRAVATGQTLRVFLLAAALPGVMSAAGLVGATPISAAPVPPSTDPIDLLLLIGLPTIAGLLAEKLKVPAGLLVGALIASAVLHATGIVHGRLPDWMLAPIFALLGAYMGARCAGTDVATLRRLLVASVGSFIVITGISVGAGVLTAWWLGLPVGPMVLAFAPGGLDVMIVLAYALELDPTLVAAHHLWRFVLLSIATPLLGLWIAGRR